MSKRRDSLKNPEIFIFKTKLIATATQFRQHCWREELILGDVLNRLIIDYLVREKVILTEESLQIEEELSH